MTGSGGRTETRLNNIEALYWSDKELAVAQARAWLIELGPGDHGSLSRRLELVIASIEALQGDAGPATARTQDLLDWAVAHGDLPLQTRCHRTLCVVFYSIVGDSGKAIEHAIAANDLLVESEPPLMKAAARMCLADALGAAGSYDESLRHYREALRIVSDDEASDFHYALLNNVAFTYFESNDTEAALEAVERLRAVLASNGRTLGMHMRDTVGRVYFAAGHVDEAEQMLGAAMAPDAAHHAPDAVAMCLVALSEVYRARAAFDEAQAAIDRCLTLCRTYELPQWTAEALREQAEIFAGMGRYREAFEAGKEFHLRSEALTVSRHEARGRVLEAAFQTAEARRESVRYRELAERDPLTGLYNRRYVDHHLGLALATADGDGASVAIAMIDLDRFKLVNDHRSHEAGDAVLRTVGRILAEQADTVPGGVAARLGGEEFLMILPGSDGEAASSCAEAVRREIEECDWQPITAGINVTASIGVAVAPSDGYRRPELLGTADSRLYAAKRAGRNRVIGSDTADAR